MATGLEPGLQARLTYPVGPDRTVPHLLPDSEHFSALPPVLATGYLVALVEWTCMKALDGHLAAGEQTLGIHIDLSHAAPTPVGHTVTIDVRLEALEGHQLTFAVHAHDDAATIAQGIHRRAMIDRAKFDRRLAARELRSASGEG